jgi:Amt family ammonium transporter
MNRFARSLALIAALGLAPWTGAFAGTGAPATEVAPMTKVAPVLLAQAATTETKKDEAPVEAKKEEAAPAAAAATEVKKEEAAPAAAATPPVPNKGDTAWMIMATVLVILMTIPGLALFYGGLVRSKNLLSILMQVTMVFSVISVLWVIYGYALTFGGAGTFFGSFDKLFLKGVTPD